jgi:hypothetical protein
MPCDSGPSSSQWDVMHQKLDDATRTACELSKFLTAEQIMQLSNGTVVWLDEHNRLDREKAEMEKKQAAKVALAAQAKDKLTPAEREALGLR